MTFATSPCLLLISIWWSLALGTSKPKYTKDVNSMRLLPMLAVDQSLVFNQLAHRPSLVASSLNM